MYQVNKRRSPGYLSLYPQVAIFIMTLDMDLEAALWKWKCAKPKRKSPIIFIAESFKAEAGQ
jgi:hypothetical protein